MACNTALGSLRTRITQSLRTRGGGSTDRWSSPGHQDRPNGYLFNRPPPPPGQSRKWEDWELPCYVTSFLTIVILGVGLNAKPDLTLETWAHQKALERLQAQAQQHDSSEVEQNSQLAADEKEYLKQVPGGSRKAESCF